MPDRTSNEIGEDLEEAARALLDGRRVPGSGNGEFLKLDLNDRGKFVYSAKATTKMQKTWARAISKLWAEAVRGARGFAGHGDGARPGMIFEVDGEVLVLTRLHDHVDLATQEIAPYVPTDKATERRQRGLRSLLE